MKVHVFEIFWSLVFCMYQNCIRHILGILSEISTLFMNSLGYSPFGHSETGSIKWSLIWR
jgi:hypothetical protein